MQNTITLLTPKNAEAGTLETLPKASFIQVVTQDTIAQETTYNTKEKLCISSEACLDTVKAKTQDKNLKKAIETVKDKALFRDILQEMYPNYTYYTTSLSAIKDIQCTKKMVVKPAKGCFGSGVAIIDKNTDMQQTALAIEKQIDHTARILSKEVLSKEKFIVEQYIDGLEYAVDMFYNDKGLPCIVNIYHHPMPKHPEYLHLIYYSSKAVFERIYDKAMAFFTTLNTKLQCKNMPLHSEFKLTQDNTLFPIELNAMRFGGMGLGNMVYANLGINPYLHYANNTTPNWDAIWQKPEHKEAIFAFFIAYNARSKSTKTHAPNIARLQKEFTHINQQTILAYQEQLAFGLFSIKETPENIAKLLQLDMDDFFDPL